MGTSGLRPPLLQFEVVQNQQSSCQEYLFLFCFSDEERYRYREYAERGYERHRASREKEERHRERRHREKEETRHKSSRRSASSETLGQCGARGADAASGQERAVPATDQQIESSLLKQLVLLQISAKTLRSNKIMFNSHSQNQHEMKNI